MKPLNLAKIAKPQLLQTQWQPEAHLFELSMRKRCKRISFSHIWPWPTFTNVEIIPRSGPTSLNLQTNEQSAVCRPGTQWWKEGALGQWWNGLQRLLPATYRNNMKQQHVLQHIATFHAGDSADGSRKPWEQITAIKNSCWSMPDLLSFKGSLGEACHYPEKISWRSIDSH